MKKLITLTLLSLITMAALAQKAVTKNTFTSTGDTIKTLVTQLAPTISLADPVILVTYSPVKAPTPGGPVIPSGPPTTTAYITSAPLNLNGISNKTYSNLSIDCTAQPNVSPVKGVKLSHVSFLNCRFVHSKTVGLDIQNSSFVTVKNCYFEDLSTGIYPQNCTGGGLVFNYNQFKNMVGPFPRGQYVQLNTCTGAGDSICYNKGENFPGKSNPEDAINLYMSSGTTVSPIFVIGNYLRGGGPSQNGGGIMLGDNGGDYQIAELNILVNPGQYGMAIAGGSNNQILNNQVYAAKSAITNVGVYVWAQGTGCSIANVSGNYVNWTAANGGLNGFWDGANCGKITELANVWNASLDPAKMLPTPLITMN